MCTTGFSETLIAIYQTTLHLYLQYGGISLPQNVDSYLPNFMVSRTRIQFRGTLEVVSLGSLDDTWASKVPLYGGDITQMVK